MEVILQLRKANKTNTLITTIKKDMKKIYQLKQGDMIIVDIKKVIKGEKNGL